MSESVRDAMTTTLISVAPLTPVTEVLALLAKHHIRHLPVVDADGVLRGLISDRDVLGRAMGPMSWLGTHELEQALSEMTAREVMTDELRTVSSDAPLVQAARILLATKFGCLPVVDDGKLVGIVTEADFVQRYVDHS